MPTRTTTTGKGLRKLVRRQPAQVRGHPTLAAKRKPFSLIDMRRNVCTVTGMSTAERAIVDSVLTMLRARDPVKGERSMSFNEIKGVLKEQGHEVPSTGRLLVILMSGSPFLALAHQGGMCVLSYDSAYGDRFRGTTRRRLEAELRAACDEYHWFLQTDGVSAIATCEGFKYYLQVTGDVLLVRRHDEHKYWKTGSVAVAKLVMEEDTRAYAQIRELLL